MSPTLPVNRTDDGDDVVSFHHKMPRRLRKRLKHYSVESEQSMVSIINAAIAEYLDTRENQADPS